MLLLQEKSCNFRDVSGDRYERMVMTPQLIHWQLPGSCVHTYSMIRVLFLICFPGETVAKYHFVKYFMKMDFFCSGKRVNSRILRMGFDL